MANTVICRIIPTSESAVLGNGQAKAATSVATLDVYPASGSVQWQLTVGKQHDLKLQFGDRIKCVSGAAVVMINPGTIAGAFLLCKKLPAKSDWKFRTELEINDETTRPMHRNGKIEFAKDIGSINRATGATTR